MQHRRCVQSIALAAVMGAFSVASCDTQGGHSHERGKMKLVDLGDHHAGLTAHLAKAGNELDVFIETGDDPPRPVAIAVASFTATATTPAGTKHELRFDPAPASERPADEKPGTCSHFVAAAPWMKSDEEIEVVARVPLATGEATAAWKKFLPAKYAHHVE